MEIPRHCLEDCYTGSAGNISFWLSNSGEFEMKVAGILNTCAVLIAMVSMAGCADPEPEVVSTSGSATNSERDSVSSSGPARPDTRPAEVEERNGRDMAAVDREPTSTGSQPRDSRDSRLRDSWPSESRSSQPAGPGAGVGVGAGIGSGPVPGIRPPGGNDLSDSSSGIGMASRDNAARIPGVSGQPEPGGQPAPREYKLEFTSASGAKGLEVGDTIPEVSGKDLDNIKFKLSDYKGKVIMLDFWGDW